MFTVYYPLLGRGNQGRKEGSSGGSLVGKQLTSKQSEGARRPLRARGRSPPNIHLRLKKISPVNRSPSIVHCRPIDAVASVVPTYRKCPPIRGLLQWRPFLRPRRNCSSAHKIGVSGLVACPMKVYLWDSNIGKA